MAKALIVIFYLFRKTQNFY